MADLQLFSQYMFYDENIFKPEVRLDEDGFYRWRYRLDNVHDRKMYSRLIKIWALISIAGLAGGFLAAAVPDDLVRKDPSRYPILKIEYQVLYALLGYAVFFIFGMLITGLIRLIEGGASVYWYQMSDEFVQIQPSGRGSGISAFSEVKRVELTSAVNEILLISRWGKCPVLVRAEDFELVKDHIFAHLPENTEIIMKQ